MSSGSILFHHDPAHDDAKIDAMVDWARQFVTALGLSLPVEAAREGSEVLLGVKRAGGS